MAQRDTGGYQAYLSAHGLGRSVPAPTRIGADALPGRSLTGPVQTPMGNLNPTNAKAYGLGTAMAGNALPWNAPSQLAPAWYGHDAYLMAEIATRVAQMQAAQRDRDRAKLGNVAAGSVNPISYPPSAPMPAPASRESQQQGYAQQDIRVHGTPNRR